MRNYFKILKMMKPLLDLYSFKGKYFYVSLFTNIRIWLNQFETIEKFIPSEGKIVDIGCGYGIFSNYLALCSDKRSIVGVDKNKRKIKYAQRGLKNTEFKSGDVTKMDLGLCAGFSLIDVLHHLESYQQQEELLKFCYDSLERKGIILIKEIDTRPRVKYIFTKFVDSVVYPFDKIYFRNKDEFRKILENIGFAVKFYSIHEGTPYSAFALVGEK